MMASGGKQSACHLAEAEARALRRQIRDYCARTSTQLGDLVRVANSVGTVRVAQFLHADGPITRSVATRLRRVMARAGEGCANGRIRAGGEPLGMRLDGAALAARIAADQAALHGPRLRWLAIEQQKYGLRARGRRLEEMAA